MKKIITCYNRLVDIQPKNSSQWLCSSQKIKRSVQIRITGITTMVTMEKTFISDTKFSTMGTGLRSISWTNSHSHVPFSNCFILNELSQLKSTPITNHSIKPFASVSFSYSCQILHNKEGSGFNTLYNTFAYNMVHISGKPFLSARQSFKVSLSRFSAFTLKPCSKTSEPINMIFDITKELLVACNSNVVDTQVNTNHTFDRAKVDIDLIGNTKIEEEIAIPHKEFTFSNAPISIFGEIGWYIKREFNSAIDCAKAKNIAFEGETPCGIISDTAIENRLGFRPFTAFISPLDSSYNELGLELWEFGSYDMITGIIEFEVGFMSFPTYINSIIDCIRINRDSISDRSIVFKFDFNNGSVFHINQNVFEVYKCCVFEDK